VRGSQRLLPGGAPDRRGLVSHRARQQERHRRQEAVRELVLAQRRQGHLEHQDGRPGSRCQGADHRPLQPQGEHGPLRAAVGFCIAFDETRTTITRVDPRDVEELAVSLPLWQRVASELRAGPQTYAQLAESLGDAKVDSIVKATKRKGNVFTKVAGNDGVHRLALVERRVS